MRRIIFSALVLSGVVASAQDSERYGRVGINTTEPNASLEIRRHEGVNAQNPQGFLLPNLTQEQRNKFEQSKLQIGLQIFNVDKNCIDWWTGRNWQCTDGSLQDTHGTPAAFREEAYYPATGTATQTFYKNNCPAGQQPKAGYSFTGQGYGVGVSVVRQDAIDKAKEAAYRNFVRLGQDAANINGECEVAPSVPQTDPIQIKDNKLKIGNTKYWFSSIKDSDYLDSAGNFIMPTENASWLDQTPYGDGTPEAKVLDVQGKIPTTPIEIAIPITTPPSQTLNLPGFVTYLEIPAEYTENGRKGIVVFTWQTTTLQTSTKYFKATINAKDSEILLKKLDMVKGMGKDHMGLSLGVIKYPIDASDNVPAQWKGEINLRLISGIPDRRFNVETNVGGVIAKRHQFIYVPSMGADGKIWFGNNLGANYANINHSAFNPGIQATSSTDKDAYGSLGQWGRAFDGHELMNWAQNKPMYTSSQISWMGDSTLTQFNENCPTGWHTPSNTEYETLRDAVNASSVNITNPGHLAGGLRLPLSGYRSYNGGASLHNVGSYFYLWSSTPYSSSSSSAHYFSGGTGSVSTYSYDYRSNGFAFRCLKD